MSVPLPAIDMSQYPVGGTSYITLDAAKTTQPSSSAMSTEKAHIRVYNDSGSHLKVWMDTGDLNEYLPAGGWLTWAIDQTANEFHWTVVNLLANAPVQLMLITYYKQGEEVPEIPQLGNSPIGGSVATTGGTPGVANQLINTGGAASTTPVIQIAEAGATGNQMFADNQGNFLISQYVSSVLTQLFRVIAGVANGGALANANIVIGDVNHAIQMNGFLYQQNTSNFNGTVNINNAQLIETFSPSAGYAFNQLLGFGSNLGSIGWQALFGAGDAGGVGFNVNNNQATPNGGVGFQVTGPQARPFAPDNPAFSQANGSVSGTLYCYVAIWGTSLKMAWVYLSGFQTASNTIVTFPSAMQSGIILPGDIGGSTTAQLFNGASPVNARQGIYATTGGTAGTSSSQANIRAQGFYTFLGTIDRIAINTTGGAGINNGIMIMGF